MKVFISADIEGTCYTTNWDNAEKGHEGYTEAAQQMTAEVKAACEGAIAAGADQIVVNDAHWTGCNIDPLQLPECCEIIRGWSGSPLSMVDGIDESYDACMFVGYHSAAGRVGNPLSHTHDTTVSRVLLNGRICSEFMLYSWAAAMFGVPSVFLSGDKMLTEDSQGLHAALKTVAVKDGIGGMTRSLQPGKACKLIAKTVEEALCQNYKGTAPKLPEHFVFDITYKEQKDAVKFSNYPGFERIDDMTIRMETDSYMDVLRAVTFII